MADQPKVHFHPGFVPGITNRQLLGLVYDAQASCRCDGGNTECKACVAERKLKGHKLDTSAQGLHDLRRKLEG